MNITVDTGIGTDLKFDDLCYGDVFISFDRDSADTEPNIFMKGLDSTDPDHPKEYVIDLQTGQCYDDVDMYPIDKVINDDFVIDLS